MTTEADKQSKPEPSALLAEHALDQWWFKELESIHGVQELSMDQYRAVNIARNALRAVLRKSLNEN